MVPLWPSITEAREVKYLCSVLAARMGPVLHSFGQRELSVKVYKSFGTDFSSSFSEYGHDTWSCNSHLETEWKVKELLRDPSPNSIERLILYQQSVNSENRLQLFLSVTFSCVFCYLQLKSPPLYTIGYFLSCRYITQSGVLGLELNRSFWQAAYCPLVTSKQSF